MSTRADRPNASTYTQAAMQPTESILLEPLRDRARIRTALGEGNRLVACLCAAWCTACASWRPAFAALAAERPGDCFVWIDIEDHADLIADLEVETLPVLLIQAAGEAPEFTGPIEPRAGIVRSLLQHGRPADASLDDAGIRNVLLAHPPHP